MNPILKYLWKGEQKNLQDSIKKYKIRKKNARLENERRKKVEMIVGYLDAVLVFYPTYPYLYYIGTYTVWV